MEYDKLNNKQYFALFVYFALFDLNSTSLILSYELFSILFRKKGRVPVWHWRKARSDMYNKKNIVMD